MGKVWRGYDQVLNRDVAIKEILLPAQLGDTERNELVARLEREARAAAKVSHPGVITIHDVVLHGGMPWVVMEYINGKSLGAELAASGRLPWQRVAEIGAKIADALAHAHAAGIVHRDLKPDNVLLAGDRVIVTDFGLAQVSDASTKLTQSHTIMGTLQFMAPEQFDDSRVGTEADIWALGATLYTAVEGNPPFNGTSPHKIMAAILYQEPQPAEHAGPMAEVLTRLLAKSPDRRPSATATIQLLRTLDHANYAAYSPTATRSIFSRQRVPAAPRAKPVTTPRPGPRTAPTRRFTNAPNPARQAMSTIFWVFLTFSVPYAAIHLTGYTVAGFLAIFPPIIGLYLMWGRAKHVWSLTVDEFGLTASSRGVTASTAWHEIARIGSSDEAGHAYLYVWTSGINGADTASPLYLCPLGAPHFPPAEIRAAILSHCATVSIDPM